MLTYKQKIKKTNGKVTMDNFDLYADLPPLSPVEDKDKPPAMSRTDIKTLQKHPYMAGSRRSSVVTSNTSNSSSSVESWLPQFSANISQAGGDRQMLEMKTSVGFDMSHSKKAKDCLEVLPQNTVPMAKYRKNFIRKKLLKESAELEGTITDEDLWKRRKAQEEKERIAIIKRRQSGAGKGGVVDDKLHDLDDDYESLHQKRTLEEEIFRPTYVADADLDEESFFSAIGKSLPRRKIAVVSAVMQKVEKRRQEKEERKLNEKIMAELNMIGKPTDRRNSTAGDLKPPETDTKNAETSENKTDQPEPMESPGNESQIDVGNTTESSIENQLSETQNPIDQNQESSTENPVERKESTIRPQRLHPVAKKASFLKKSYHKSEGDLVAAVNSSSFAPPEDFCDTGAMISYSEILMASAKHLEHTVSMIDISQPELDFKAYVPQMADYVPKREEPKTYFLPPEIGEDTESLMSDVGYASPVDPPISPNILPVSPVPERRPAREPIYSKVKKKPHANRPHSAARRQSTNLSTKRRMHRSHAGNLNTSGKTPRSRIERSASSSDLVIVHRLAAIVEKQGELMERWQNFELERMRASTRSLNNQSSLNTNYDMSFSDADQPASPPILHPRRPSLATSTSVQSRETFSDSSSNYQLASFDDLTYASIGDVRRKNSPVDIERSPEIPTNSVPTRLKKQTHETKKTDLTKLVQKPEKEKYRRTNEAQHSKVKSPNGNEYNEREISLPSAANNPPTRPVSSITPETKEPIIKNTKIKSPNRNVEAVTDRKPQMPRRKSTRKEITREPSQMIKIDIIKSSGEMLGVGVADGSLPPPGSVSASRSNSAVGVRRRRSLVRVQGIRNQRNEGAEELSEKIQSVVDAGTGMDGEGEGWWVVWAKREGGDKKSDGKIVKRVASLFRKDDIEKRKEIDVVAELVQKLPGEEGFNYYETQPRMPEVPETVEIESNHSPPLRHRNRSRGSSLKSTRSPKKKKALRRAPSFDEDVSDIGPLPPSNVKSAKKMRVPPVLPKKQPSFDSGVSTNPTDDDGGDVSPKSLDGRAALSQNLGKQSLATKADKRKEPPDETKQDKQTKENGENQQTDSNADSTAKEESFLKKMANFFGISYEEPVEEQIENTNPKPISIFA